MAAETQHAGLTADERSTIRSTVLKARETIENDLYRQLERYGVYDDERVDIDALGHLDADDKQTRSQIDAALDRELEATDDDYERSVKNYVREATKTYLNRLVALKAIEVRGLVTETMITRPEYGNRSEMHRTVDEVAGELTDQSDNGLGVAVELAFTELSDEIGVIFEENEHTAIDLDFTIREEIIEKLNAIDESVWESDEAMGWVYQYFGENEREEIDDRIDEENYKVQDTDVATKTQLFTPRYIVEWMVDNSLGRLWLEMQGEKTNIDQTKCSYLSPLEDSLIDRENKKVQNIKVLDPACGSGQMLFYAFDLLYEMYLEESTVAEKYIPKEILKNNLYGIDIDPGAAQIAALALYVKAKSKEPEVNIEQINIVSADTILANGERKSNLKNDLNEMDQLVVDEVWDAFKDIREFGSLVRIEQRIDEILEEWDADGRNFAPGQTRLSDTGGLEGQADLETTDDNNGWRSAKEHILSEVSNIAQDSLENNNVFDQIFSGDIKKTVNILDILLDDYDVVVTNPPYLNSGKMSEEINSYVKSNYSGYRDLYAAFIERVNEFTTDTGYTSLITPETFMYLSSFDKMRSNLIDEVRFLESVHLRHRDEGYMNTCFIMRQKDQDHKELSKFIRLINYSDKERRLNEVLSDASDDHDTYVVDQDSFKDIKGSPFTYWFGENILRQFSKNKELEELVFSQSGIKTGNNKKFLRKIWEAPKEDIFDRYIPVAHSENSIDHYDETTFLIDWKDNGEYIERYGDKHGHQYFFGEKSRHYEESVGFQVNSKYFLARYIPEKHLAINQLYLIFPDGITDDILYVNSWLNSSLVKFLINGFNPTANFTQGDIFRLPYLLDGEYNSEIVEYASEIISRIDEKSQLKETTLQFNEDKFKQQLENDIEDLKLKFELVNADRMVLHGLIDDLIFENYNITETDEARIYDELPENLSRYAHAGKVSELSVSKHEYRSEVPIESPTDEEAQQLVEEISEHSSSELRDISEDLGVSPYTVASLKYEHSLYTRDERRTIAGRILSYYIGCAFGNWELEGLKPAGDGILVFDSDLNNSVMEYVRESIKLTSGEASVFDKEQKIESMLNKDLSEWLQEDFFRKYHCKEYRRRGQRIPIYWQLESTDGHFSCFLYYHSLNLDTLSTLRGQYVDVKLDTLQNRFETLEKELEQASDSRAQELRSQRELIEKQISDINDFRQNLDALINDGFSIDYEDGIWKNIQKVEQYDLLAVSLDKL